MRGDVSDIVGRLRSVLPARWFSDESPNLLALLTCVATPWSWIYGAVRYAILQSRLGTATGYSLDLIALDFFGLFLTREPGEADGSYRSRIEWALRQGAATRFAVAAELTHLTGNAPTIFEPARAADTGAYANGTSTGSSACVGLAYGMAGGWGSLQLPFQFFVSVRRPTIQGVSSVAGYGTSVGGYGIGIISYIDLAMLPGSVTDADIADSLQRILPINATAWLQIS